jgi:hypothetical protein
MDRHHRPSGIRLSRIHERWVLGVGITLEASGALWLLFHYFVLVRGEFGSGHHPLETWLLELHGAAAMVFFVVLGTLLPIHVRRAWQLNRNQGTGAVTISTVAILSLSGYGLYYAGGEEARSWISTLHWIIGLVGIPVIVLHILLGKRAAARAGHVYTRKRHRVPAGDHPGTS